MKFSCSFADAMIFVKLLCRCLQVYIGIYAIGHIIFLFRPETVFDIIIQNRCKYCIGLQKNLYLRFTIISAKYYIDELTFKYFRMAQK